MIEKTNALNLFEKNLQRTEMLIRAIEKISAYNRIYQAQQTELQHNKVVKSVQDKELVQIEKSCAEHALISLVTAFETYYNKPIGSHLVF